MIWTAYKAVAKTVVNCLATVIFRYDRMQVYKQLYELDRLDRIIKCIQRSYTMHPSVLERTYHSTEGYLQQHLSEEDWAYWLRLNATASVRMHQMQQV